MLFKKKKNKLIVSDRWSTMGRPRLERTGGSCTPTHTWMCLQENGQSIDLRGFLRYHD